MGNDWKPMTPVARIAHFVFAPLTSICCAVLLTAGCSKTLEGFQTQKPMDHIIGGIVLAKNHYVATTTALLYNADFKTNFCTVTLISKEYAITAAHCVEIARADSFFLVFGTNDSPQHPRRQVKAASMLRQRESQATETRNSFDVALLKFAGGLPPGYQPATLLPEKLEHLFKVGTLTAIAGYGLDNLTEGPIDTLRLTDLRISNPTFTPTEILLDQSHGHGACKGDSGGPAFFFIGGKFYLWGVASRGVNRNGELVGDCAQYVAYSKAALFLPGLMERFQQ